MKLLVLYGGYGLSDEAEISKLSGESVIQAAKDANIDVEGFLVTKDNYKQIVQKVAGYDLVFPVLHGSFGENGEVQGLLDEAGVLYIGSDAQSSRLCMDKVKYKEKMRASNILTADWKVVRVIEDLSNMRFPYVIKPIASGSSVDTFICLNENPEVTAAMDIALEKYGSMLAEEYIKGVEITVGVIGNEALPVVEIIPPEGGWFDYTNKYNGATQELVPAQTISTEIQQKAQGLSHEIHRICGCKDLSRTDFIVRDDKLYVLETNTMPGMTTESLLPKAAQAAGYSMADLISLLTKVYE